MTKFFSLLSCTFLLSQAALASAPVFLEDHRCVTASIGRAHQSITDYENYSRIPGALYQLKVLGQGINLLRMIKSQSRYALREMTRTDALVWVVLQPVNITDAEFYPRVLLHCMSEAQSPEHFSHRCDMVTDKPHYSISNFSSRLEVSADSPDCEKGETKLDYTLAIEMIDDDVLAIKTEALRPLGSILAPLVGAFFDPDKFFRSYYKQYYESWAQQL